MIYQCPSCDKIGTSLNDFMQCQERKHIEPLFYPDKNEKISIKNQKPKEQSIIKKIKGRIHSHFVESILVDEKPFFLCYNYDNGRIAIKESVSAEQVLVKPLEINDYGYIPYKFSGSEIEFLMNSSLSKEAILDQIMSQINKFLVLDERDKYLIMTDILLSYYQEQISTLHYPFFVGETESGKSSAIHMFRWLAYRCLIGEDIPLADVYNFLGTDEEGAGTIAEDEAQEIERNREKIRMYKNSYAKGSVKPRIILTNNSRKQFFYKTFCIKVFAGEKIPDDKGFKERLAIVKMIEGTPSSNIKRITDQEKAELNKIRNLLLVFKIQNIANALQRIDSGLQQRDQELWEDFLSIVHGTKYFEKCKETVRHYTEQRHETIWNSLEATIFQILIKNLELDLSVRLEAFWQLLTAPEGMSGGVDKGTFYPNDFAAKITRNYLSKLFESKFQAKRKTKYTTDENGKKHMLSVYVFERTILDSLRRKYHVSEGISGHNGSKGGQLVLD